MSSVLNSIQLRTRLRVVDNSEIGKQAMTEGKPPRCIHVYKPSKRGRLTKGYIGDKVLVTIKGQMKKAILVGLVAKQAPFVPRFDSNNIVLIDDKGSPIGNRVLVPIPNLLRNEKYRLNKIIAISTKFV